MIVTAIFGTALYLLMLVSSIWLVVKATRSGDYDCALGGVFILLLILGFTAFAIGV